MWCARHPVAPPLTDSQYFPVFVVFVVILVVCIDRAPQDSFAS